jgi:hypothetical protein
MLQVTPFNKVIRVSVLVVLLSYVSFSQLDLNIHWGVPLATQAASSQQGRPEFCVLVVFECTTVSSTS